MASQFDTLFAAAGIPSLLDQFGVPAVYRPRGGSDRSVTIVGTADELPATIDETTERQHERLWAFCRRDATLGIDAPQDGDVLRRTEDAADSPWTYQGEIRNETAGSWELLFARIRPRRYGPRTA